MSDLDPLVETITDYVNILIGVGAALAGILAFHRRFIRPSIQKIEAMAELLEAQLIPNGGKNLVDRAGRIPIIEATVDRNHKEAERHWGELGSALGEVVERIDKVEKKLA